MLRKFHSVVDSGSRNLCVRVQHMKTQADVNLKLEEAYVMAKHEDGIKQGERIKKAKHNLRSVLIGERMPCHIKVGDMLIRKGDKLTPTKIDRIATKGIDNCKWQSTVWKKRFKTIAERSSL